MLIINYNLFLETLSTMEMDSQQHTIKMVMA